MDELQSTDEQPFPSLWWIIMPDGERELCYVCKDALWEGGDRPETITAWNKHRFRAVYTRDEWETACFQRLVRPVRPQTAIQRVILDAVETDVLAPGSGAALYRETLEVTANEQDPALAGEGARS